MTSVLVAADALPPELDMTIEKVDGDSWQVRLATRNFMLHTPSTSPSAHIPGHGRTRTFISTG